jgi:hypothetical protein
MMAYVHQAEEILKEGANLLQKHQTMKTEVPYGDMFSSFEYCMGVVVRSSHCWVLVCCLYRIIGDLCVYCGLRVDGPWQESWLRSLAGYLEGGG